MVSYCQSKPFDQVDDILEELLAIKILPHETATEYLTRADEIIAQLNSAKHTYSVNRVGRAIVVGLVEPYSTKAGPLSDKLLDKVDIDTLCKRFVKRCGAHMLLLITYFGLCSL